MARRIEVVNLCDRCGKSHPGVSVMTAGCFGDGGSRRVLDPGSFVLIEKVDGEWPEWALHAANPFDIVLMGDGYKSLASREPDEILDALAGGEQP